MVSFDMAAMERISPAIRLGRSGAALRAKPAERMAARLRRQGRMWAEITAASHRKPEIARICCGIEDLVGGNLVSILASG
jgi:hypothetical protein